MTRIETEKQYQAAMARIEELLPLVTEDTPEDDIHSVELVHLSNLVADYDDTHYPINKYFYDTDINYGTSVFHSRPSSWRP